MSHEFWSEVPNWLVAVFTGFTLAIAWKGFLRLERANGPSVFGTVERSDLGRKLVVTIRNRANHPTKISRIAVAPRWRIRMAQIELEHDGVGGGRSVANMARAIAVHDLDIELGSSDKGHATAQREFVLIPAFGKLLPRKFDVIVTYEAEDGVKLKTAAYPVRLPEAVRS